MAIIYPKDEDWLVEMNNYAKAAYGQAATHALEIEDVYRGQYALTKDIEDSDIEIVRPSKPYALVHKMISMLAIRSEKSIIVAQDSETAQEAKRADKLERWLHAYLDEHTRQKQRDPFRDSVYYAVMRGRAGLMTIYDPLKRGMKIRIQALDPFSYWPVTSDEGVEWFTREYRMSRLEMETFYDKVERTKGARPEPAALKESSDDDENSMSDMLRVIEYWDEKWHAFSVDGQFYRYEHNYGFCPLAEYRFNETPEQDQRWAYAGLLSAVLEDLKLHAGLLSKMATGAEQFYFPRMYYITQDGSMGMVSHHAANPGDWVEIMDGTQPVIVNPTANTEAVQSLLQLVESSIGETTLNPIVFSTDIPDSASGYLYNQFYSIVEDNIADKRGPLERGFGISLGHVLRLAEKFCYEQEGGVWSMDTPDADDRRLLKTSISEEDIGGHYNVRFRVKVSLPQDKVGMATQFNMMREAPPGMPPEMAKQDAFVFSGIGDAMGDVSGMINRADFEFLKQNDEEVAMLHAGHVKYENRRELDQWRKEADRYTEYMASRKAHEVEKKLDDPVEVPAHLKANAGFWQGLAEHIAGGGNAEDFINQVVSQAPTADLFITDEEAGAFMNEFEGGPPPPEQAPPQQQPQGVGAPFQGFEGVNPAVSPPAERGAMPRRALDQARLQPERAATLQRRGTRPPPS